MKKKYARIVEAFVVSAMFTLLLIVVFPRFIDAQKRGKVAAAKRDVSAIMQAMESYRLDFGGESVQSVLAHREYQKENTFYTVITTLANNRDVILPPDVLLPYLKKYPVPRLPEQIEGNPPAYGPMYMVGRHDYRFLDRPYNGREADEALFWFTFYKDKYKTDYLGVAHGPLFVYDPFMRGGVSFDGRRQYVEYDPSNGLVSHGYITSEWGDNLPTPTPVSLPKSTPTPWTPVIGELQANLTAATAAVAIQDATGLIEYQRRLISTLELVWRGNYTDNTVEEGRKWRMESETASRAKAIKGTLPGGLTAQDIDRFYESYKNQRTFPMEFSYAYAGEKKQKKSIHYPQLTINPWESSWEDIFDWPNSISILHNDKIMFLNNMNSWSTPEQYVFIFQKIVFQPLWCILPLKDFLGKSPVSWTLQSDGLVRVRWSAHSFNENPAQFYTLDMRVDPAIGYLPRRSLYVVPNIWGESIPDESKISHLSVYYAEMEDFKSIDSVYFPTRIRVSKWLQYNDNRYPSTPSRGSYKGFAVPDVIGGKPVPDPEDQWDFTLVSAKINQPIDAKVFSPDLPEGYSLQDNRK